MIDYSDGIPALFPTGKSGFSDILVGSYRTEAMEVVSGTFGRERIHYRAPGPERVYDEMDKFLLWFNAPNIAPSLLKSAIAHFWFVCIHPFDDGNGRIARAIQIWYYPRQIAVNCDSLVCLCRLIRKRRLIIVCWNRLNVEMVILQNG